MNILENAILYASEAHEGQTRKLTKTPYILHPLEVACIVSTITNDPEVLAAGVLHDTVEDCGVSLEEIRARFGDRVAELVKSETEDKMPEIPPEQSWKKRKEDSLVFLKNSTDRDVKILWLGDKLSNMRSICRDYKTDGEGLWGHFHQKSPEMQAWYYNSVKEALAELSDTDAYAEYEELVNLVFNGGNEK